MMEILSIRDAHMTDSTTADNTGVDIVKNALDQANHFEGSAEEAKVAMFLGQLGIRYNTKSQKMNSSLSWVFSVNRIF